MPNESIKENRTNDLASVIVLTYGKNNYLYETIDSILMQDYSPIEIIVADDGTPGFDSEKVRKYISDNMKDNIVNVVCYSNIENVGTVRSLNGALKKSRGEFIKIIAGDDTFCDKRVFSGQIDMLKGNAESLACVGMISECDIDMKAIESERANLSNKVLPKILQMKANEAKRLLYDTDSYPISIQATCFKSLFFSKYGLADERYRLTEDSPIIIRMLSCEGQILFDNRLVVNHRASCGVSSSEVITPARRMYFYDEYRFIRNEIIPNPDIYGHGLKRLFYNRRMCCYFEKKSYEKITVSIGLSLFARYLDVFILPILFLPKRIYVRIKNKK